MNPSDSRTERIHQLRRALAELAAEGIDWLPRPLPPSRPRPAGLAASAPPTGTQQASLHFPGEYDPSRVREPAEGLRQIREELGECTRCRLHEGRHRLVFGEGRADAAVAFVGEGPGAEEDRTGRPFVGRAGELLTRMIEAVGWKREDVYICNVIKCRPPGNRDPQVDEVATCRPFLEKQLLTIRPRVIVTLGKSASSTLLGRNVAITKVRGVWQEWNGIPLMPTFHPAYLLRNYTRATRQAVWDDLRAVLRYLDEPAPR